MNDIAIVAGGRRYTGWTELVVSRGIDRCASHFEVSVMESLIDQPAAVPLAPYDAVEIFYGEKLMLSGYVDQYAVQFGDDRHEARIVGRSKTGQLIDCMPDVKAGQFLGYSLAAIARSLAGIFGVSVNVETSLADAPVADATMERCEKAFRFLDRLAAVAGVLLCDDETGALLITTAGASRAAGALVQGENIINARLMAAGERRFSIYIVKGQRGIGGAAGASGFAPGGDGVVALQTTPSTGAVLTQQRATATDSGVPIYRPNVTMAESQLDQAQMQQRADWQRSYAYGQSLKCEITVPGWTQPNGDLWTINQIIAVESAFLGLDQDLLVMEVAYRFELQAGHTTTLTVGPVEGAIPSPALLASAYRKGKQKKGASSISWNGVAKG